MLIFAWPLWQWVRHALHSDLQSHVLLIPFISWYLVRQQKKNAPAQCSSALNGVQAANSGPGSRRSLPGAALAGALGLCSLAAWWIFHKKGVSPVETLALPIFALQCLVLSAALAFLGWRSLRPYLFPIGFLLFMLPLPSFLVEGLSVALQYASAEASNLTLRLTGMPVLRDGLSFLLPGLRIFVAEECSGIRSTLVLFITSLLGSYLFLRRGWSRLLFVLAVFPLGVFRNALRITTISWLTVNVNSHVIDSPLHHRGGPLFFAVSLVPLFGLLWLLRRSDLKRARSTGAPSASTADRSHEASSNS